MNKFNFSFTFTNTILLYLENGNSYIAEKFNKLSKNISHSVVA